MEIPPLLRLSYWFDTSPTPFASWFEKAQPIVFGALFFVGVLLRIVALKQGWEKMTKRALARISAALMALGVFGFLLAALSYERVPVLSMRAGYLLWLALFIWYSWRIYKFIWQEIPAWEKKKAEREELNRWLPQSKT